MNVPIILFVYLLVIINAFRFMNLDLIDDFDVNLVGEIFDDQLFDLDVGDLDLPDRFLDLNGDIFAHVPEFNDAGLVVDEDVLEKPWRFSKDNKKASKGNLIVRNGRTYSNPTK